MGGGTTTGPVRERRSIARWFFGVFLTLRGRLILLVCFATVPALLFIFFAAAKEREAALERMEVDARHLGSLASREHAHQLNGARELLRRLGAGLACDGPAASAKVCPEYLPTLLSGFPQFANLGVAEPDGNVVCSAAPMQHPVNLGKTTAFERALASDDVEAGTYVIAPIVGRPVLHLAHALRGPDHAPCAVLFVAVELRWLDHLSRQANLPADYSLLITDRAGRVVARARGARPPPPGGRAPPPPQFAQALDRPPRARRDRGGPPSSRYFVATPMEDVPGVFVVAGLPYERVQRTANQAFYRTLVGLALVTIFAIASAIFAAELSVLRVLRALTRAVRRFGAGDLAARAPLPEGHGELRELAVSFSAMADALGRRQREAAEAQERLRALSHRLQVARDQEASRIARELHDELGQILTGLKMDLSRVRRVFSGGARSSDGEAVMLQMSEQIDRAIDSVRRLSSELRPPVLDRLGLAAALDWLARECEKKTGIAVLLDVDDLREPIDALVSTTVFRIVQEALTNVVRHAAASEVTVDLAGRDDTLSLTIRDDGKGIDPAALEGLHSLGILGMRERVHLLGGSWRIEGERGKGTRIIVEVPRRPPHSLDGGAGAEQSP